MDSRQGHWKVDTSAVGRSGKSTSHGDLFEQSGEKILGRRAVCDGMCGAAPLLSSILTIFILNFFAVIKKECDQISSYQRH